MLGRTVASISRSMQKIVYSASLVSGSEIFYSPVNVKEIKKPVGAYAFFVQKNFKDVKTANPGFKFPEVVKTLAKQWNSSTEIDRADYVTASESRKAHYNDTISKLTPTEQTELEAEKAKRKKVLLSRRLKKLASMHGKPKKPTPSFLLFSVDYRKNVPMPSSLTDKIALSKTVGASWNQLSPMEKEKYKSRYLEAAEQYKKDLEEWKEQMRKQGLDAVLAKLTTGKKMKPKKKKKVAKKAARAGAAKRIMANSSKRVKSNLAFRKTAVKKRTEGHAK